MKFFDTIANFFKQPAAEPTESERLWLEGHKAFARGSSLYCQKVYQQALHCFDTAIDSGFERAEVYSMRGGCLNFLKFHLDAIADFTKAIEFEADDSNSYFSRANSKIAVGDMQGGIEDFKEAIRVAGIDSPSNRSHNAWARENGYKDGVACMYRNQMAFALFALDAVSLIPDLITKRQSQARWRLAEWKLFESVVREIRQYQDAAKEYKGTRYEMGERATAEANAEEAGIDWFQDSGARFSIEGDASAAKPEKGAANAKAPPPVPADAMKVVMKYAVGTIQKGFETSAHFNAEMIEKYGPKIKPYLADIFKTATKLESFMAVKTKEGKSVKKPKAQETPEQIAERIAKEHDENPDEPLSRSGIFGMVRAHVQVVMAEAIRLTTLELSGQGLEVTEGEVRDAFTQYVKRTPLKKDPLSVKMREIRRIGQLVSAVRDAVQGKKEAEAALAAGEKPTDLTKPKLTGLERDKATQAVRDMDKARIAAIKELQEAASALGIDIGGGGSMASTLAAAKTRMTNAIEDVEREIRTKQRIQRSKKGVNYDAEATELKAKLDARRKERDAIFGPNELTDEQRLAAALAAAIRNEQEWNNKLAMARFGIFKPTASTYRLVTSPELEEIKARTAAAREAVADLKADQPFDPDAWLAKTEKAIATRTAKLEERLASGDILPPVKAERPD